MIFKKVFTCLMIHKWLWIHYLILNLFFQNTLKNKIIFGQIFCTIGYVSLLHCLS